MTTIRTIPRSGLCRVEHIRLVTYARNGHDVTHFVPADVIDHKVRGRAGVSHVRREVTPWTSWCSARPPAAKTSPPRWPSSPTGPRRATRRRVGTSCITRSTSCLRGWWDGEGVRPLPRARPALTIEASTDDEPGEDDTARDLSGGYLGSACIEAGPTDRYMGFTNGREADE